MEMKTISKEENIQLTTLAKILLVLRRNVLLIFLAALIVIASLISDAFFSFENLTNVIRQISLFGILALGLTFCVIAGNMDLSIGSLVGLISVIAIRFVHYNYILAIFISLVVGLLCGALNGVVVGKLKTNPIIVTLGTLAVYQGMALTVSGGYMLFGVPDSPFSFIGKGFIFNVPFPVYVFVIFSIILYYLLSRTPFGKHVYATGCNDSVTTLMGIDVGNVRMMTYIISGLCCAVVGIIIASRMTGAYPYSGTFYLFDAITAVILGGTSLYGGKGSIRDTIIGILVLGVLYNILLLIGIPYAIQQFFTGAVLILAIIINPYLGRN